MTVNFTLNLENWFIFRRFYEYIEHNRKICNKIKSQKKVCETKNVQQVSPIEIFVDSQISYFDVKFRGVQREWKLFACTGIGIM